MSKKYELKTISDLLLIPEEKFDDFLVDLKKWHYVARSTKSLVDTIASVVGEEQPANSISMVWIDDGRHDGRIVFRQYVPKS